MDLGFRDIGFRGFKTSGNVKGVRGLGLRDFNVWGLKGQGVVE